MSLLSHSFGALSPGMFHRDVFPPHFVYITFLLWKGNSLYARMILGLLIQKLFKGENWSCLHVCNSSIQQRYNWEGTHVIFFHISRLWQWKTSGILTEPNKYLFDGAGKGQGSYFKNSSGLKSVYQFACLELLSWTCTVTKVAWELYIWSHMLLLRYWQDQTWQSGWIPNLRFWPTNFSEMCRPLLGGLGGHAFPENFEN